MLKPAQNSGARHGDYHHQNKNKFWHKGPAITEKTTLMIAISGREQNSKFYKAIIKDAQNNKAGNVSGQLTAQNNKYARHSGEARKSRSSAAGSIAFGRPCRRGRLSGHQLCQVHRLGNSP